MILIQNKWHTKPSKTVTAVIISIIFRRLFTRSTYVDLYIYRKKKLITFVMQNLHLLQLMCQSAINVQCYSPHSPWECDLTPRKLIRVTMVTIPFCRLLLPPKVLAAMSPIYILLFLLVVTMTWGENTASVKFSGDIRIIIPVRTV